MADAANIPIIGPWLPYIGIGGKYSRTTTCSGSWCEGKPPAPITIGKKGTVTPIMPRQTPGTTSILIGGFTDSLNDAMLAVIWENAGYNPSTGYPYPQPPAPLPDPIMEPVPGPDPLPPLVNLPVDLPPVVVQPPAVSAPQPVPEPPPLEVPLEVPPDVEFPAIPAVNPGAGPGSVASPASSPGSSPSPAVRAVGSALSRAALELAIASFIAPNLAQSAAPAASFRTRAAPTAQPRPPASTTPNLPPGTGVDFLKPILPSTPIIPGQTPLAGLNSGLNLSAQPSPQQKLDKCKCKEPEKKKREPTKPREVCYQGTYRQLSKGISYHRGKQVPCGAASEKLATVGKVAGLKSRAIGAVTKAAKRGKVPKLGDLARDVLGF